MGSEDFSYMLQKRPGAIIWLGNGDSSDLHHPSYDFNDAAIVHGIRYWAELVKRRLDGDQRRAADILSRNLGNG
jgi:hippurate hydrolase